MKSIFVRRSSLSRSREITDDMTREIKRMQETIDKIKDRPRVDDYDVRVTCKFGEWWCDLHKYTQSTSAMYPSYVIYDGYQLPRAPVCTFVRRLGPFKTQTKAIKAGHKHVYKCRVDYHISKADHQMNASSETSMTV